MAALDRLRDKWDTITPRERRMVVLLGVSTVVILVLYVALDIRDRMVALEKKNDKSRRALVALTGLRARPAVVDPNLPAIPSEPVRLESYLYTAASKAGVTLGGVNTRGTSSRGSYTVHGAAVELRDVSLQQASDFLEAIENENRVVAVTGLQLRRNFRDKAKLELSIEVSTYSKAAATDDKAGGGSGSGSAKTGGGS